MARRDRAARASGPAVNKWELLRNLSKAGRIFGLSDPELTVLQALLSFHPQDMLGDGAIVVFPSNRSLCERLNGMACSTMRRHLSRLIETGLVDRRDSPNGERYARSDSTGKVAYGLDLAPLPRRAAEIADAARQLQIAEDRLRRLREAVSLVRRDLVAVATYGAQVRPELGLWDQCQDMAALTARALRRKLSEADLEAIRAELTETLNRVSALLDEPETAAVPFWITMTVRSAIGISCSMRPPWLDRQWGSPGQRGKRRKTRWVRNRQRWSWPPCWNASPKSEIRAAFSVLSAPRRRPERSLAAP